MTIQEAAQKILLIFYKRYTTQGFITDEVMQFEHDSEWELDFDDELLRPALEDEIGSPILIKNALQYLDDKGLITFKTRGLLSGDFAAYLFSLTSRGVDMIEGVGGAGNTKTIYQNTFNVKLTDNINVESLLKTELKGSVLSLFQ
ncbi:hypothetical protein EOM60_04480 [Candidatus Saccharibacteria bacterium]|jgi:hypothetical protein|nr:hypothetical protein [Candidatus Saccharibacteria bacterium]